MYSIQAEGVQYTGWGCAVYKLRVCSIQAEGVQYQAEGVQYTG